MDRWRVCKRDGVWRVYDGGSWHDSYDSLPDAHSAALAYSVACEIHRPGALTRLRELRDAADWWAAYERTCEELA